MKESTSFYKTADSEKLFTCDWRPDGQTDSVIVLVHGLGEHCQRYRHVADFLTGNGIAILTFDLRGHGKSGGSRGHIPSYDLAMDDIDALLKMAADRFPKKSLFLYGHSLGGNLVLYHLLHRKPVIDGAIVTSPGLRTAGEVPAWKVSLGRILYKLVPSFQMDNGLDVTGLSRNQAVVDAYKADPLVHPLVSARLGLDIIENGKGILRHAAALSIPTLLMVGSADRIIDPQAVREFAEKAGKMVTFHEWPGGYHELHNDLEQKLVMQMILDWVKGFAGSRNNQA